MKCNNCLRDNGDLRSCQNEEYLCDDCSPKPMSSSKFPPRVWHSGMIDGSEVPWFGSDRKLKDDDIEYLSIEEHTHLGSGYVEVIRLLNAKLNKAGIRSSHAEHILKAHREALKQIAD